MQVKCQNQMIHVDENDRVIDNRKCFVLITRTVVLDWATYHPTIAREEFEKLIEEKKVIKLDCKYRTSSAEYDIYRFNYTGEKDD